MSQAYRSILRSLIRPPIWAVISFSCSGCLGGSGTQSLVKSGGIVLVSPAAFQTLKPAMTMAEVRHLFQCEGQHQFTTTRDESRYVCVAYAPKVGDSQDVNLIFYLVFRDDRFTKVIANPWPAEQARDASAQGARDMLMRAEWIVRAAPGNTADQIQAAIELSSQTVRARSGGQTEPSNPIIDVVSFLTRLQVEEVARRNERASIRFIGSNVKLKMTPAHVEKLLGAARRQEIVGPDSRAAFYWSDFETGNVKLQPEYLAFGVVVFYNGGEATTVLSHGFFSKSWFAARPPVAAAPMATTRKSPPLMQWDAADQRPFVVLH